MTTYNWKIVTCEHEVATGGITVAHWHLEAVDGDYSAGAYGTISFSPDPDAEGFKPYDEVTEADVLQWVFGKLDTEAYEASLQAAIDLQKNPVTASGLPWQA